jgi:hypothetical protein
MCTGLRTALTLNAFNIANVLMIEIPNYWYMPYNLQLPEVYTVSKEFLHID